MQQRTYEVMFIIRPDLQEEEIDKLLSNLESQAANAGATVKNVERMGKRRLAYLVRKFIDGFYVLLTVEAEGKAIHEIERRLRVSEPVIKFISVRIDQEQKRLEKIKQLRSIRVKRSTAEPAVTPESAPAPAATA
ncbi:MAG: 30S ribosomal protein S6 [Acidobacteria bacterium]|nr:MAG: 30S ribosomal protein S6 [Acidobacteriota bacterium]PYY05885.1 MAG: 30S ribosomal protein S6 [Acidobacteriota bacterium]PYY24938.1 MAG: 30S ribosomal protein S6 [Acidobacteriota bacterium]